jgi:hypothetical protein
VRLILENAVLILVIEVDFDMPFQNDIDVSFLIIFLFINIAVFFILKNLRCDAQIDELLGFNIKKL